MNEKLHGREAHLAKLKNGETTSLFKISNNKGHVNGWCTLDNIFGEVIAIEGKPI